MLVKAIPTKQSFDNIQISQFSTEFSELGRITGKYMLIPISKGSFSLCKVFTSQIHPAYVKLDNSVTYSKEILHSGLPKVSLNIVDDIVNTSAIEILPTPTSIKSVNLTLVYESVFDVSPSKKSLHNISYVVKDVLRLFVFMENCVIFLKCLPTQMRFGIHSIIIDSVDCDDHGTLGFISSKTCLTINKVISKKYFEQMLKFSERPAKSFPRQAYALLKSVVDLRTKWKNSFKTVIQPPQKVIVIGPSGCGKSSLVSSVAAEAGATLVSYSSYSRSSGNHSQNIKQCFSEARALAEERTGGICILLLENLDLICKRRDRGGNSADNLSTTLQLLSLLEEASSEPNLLIVATTSTIHNVDPAIHTSSTFSFEIMMEQSEEDREDILKSLLQPLSEHYLTLAQKIAHLTPGYVAADLALIVHKVACKNDDRSFSGPEEWLGELKSTVAETRPSSSAGALGVLKKKLTIDKQLGGLFQVKKQLRATLEEPLNNPQAYIRLGLPLPKGLLMYGPPGCAKTSLVNAIASTIPVTFLSVSSADLYSPLVGEAEQNIVDLFRRARSSAPAILFIDEIDALVGRREGREAGVHDRVLSAFLMEMDGVSVPTVVGVKKIAAENQTVPSHNQTEVHTQVTGGDFEAKASDTTVVVIGATNRPDILDAALLRPGRFDKLLYVPAPDATERLDILNEITNSMPLNPDVELSRLVERTELFSGADLAHLCTTAALNALAMDGMSVPDIKMRHFEATLKDTKPSLTSDQVEWYEKFAHGL